MSCLQSGNLANNPRTTSEYDDAGRLVASTDERGHRTRYEFDAAGRQVRTIVPDDDDLSATPDLENNPVSTSEYDAAGRRIASVDALGHRTVYTHDALGRVIETTTHDGTRLVTTKTGYDDLGRRASEEDANGVKTSFEYDALGRLTAVVNALGTPDEARTEYAYDELGRLVLQRDANHTPAGTDHSVVTRYEYNGVGQRVATVRPPGQRSESTYDALGRVATMTDFSGDTITYHYDPVTGWLTDKTFARAAGSTLLPNPPVHYSYWPDGQVKDIVDSRGTTHDEYDARGRLKLRRDPDGSEIEYEYDPAGNRTSTTTRVALGGGQFDTATTDYTFDAQNRLKTVASIDALTTYTYDALSSVTETATVPTASPTIRLVERRSYDPDTHRLSRIENERRVNGVLDEVLSRYDYQYDLAGKIVDVLELGGREVQYVYDKQHRLTHEKVFASGVLERDWAYAFDDVGNRLSKVDNVSGASTAYLYDANDQLATETTGADQLQYSYDANGSNTSLSLNGALQTTNTWDQQRRLIAVESGTGVTQFEQNEGLLGLADQRRADDALLA